MARDWRRRRRLRGPHLRRVARAARLPGARRAADGLRRLLVRASRPAVGDARIGRSRRQGALHHRRHDRLAPPPDPRRGRRHAADLRRDHSVPAVRRSAPLPALRPAGDAGEGPRRRLVRLRVASPAAGPAHPLPVLAGDHDRVPDRALHRHVPAEHDRPRRLHALRSGTLLEPMVARRHRQGVGEADRHHRPVPGHAADAALRLRGDRRRDEPRQPGARRPARRRPDRHDRAVGSAWP